MDLYLTEGIDMLRNSNNFKASIIDATSMHNIVYNDLIVSVYSHYVILSYSSNVTFVDDFGNIEWKFVT